MRIEALYEFLLLSSNLNFTETARSFFLSQSVLSNRISNLEKELDCKLFIRDRHSVRLTEPGRLFVEDAKTIIGNYERALERLSQYNGGVSNVVKIGFLLGSYGSFLPLICKSYHQAHPETTFHFQTMELEHIQPSLNENRIDIGFTIFSEDIQGAKYGHLPLYKDRYKLAIPKTHRLARREKIRLSDLKDETIIAPRFNPSKNTLVQMNVKLKNVGASVQVMDDINDVGALMATLVSTGYAALTPDHLGVFGNSNIIFLPLDDDSDMDICAGAIWKTSKETETVLSFLDFLKSNTQGYTKDDFLSRDGIGSLPRGN